MEGNKWVHGHSEECAHYFPLGFIGSILVAESLPTQLFSQSGFHLNGAPLPTYASDMNDGSLLSLQYTMLVL